MPRNRPDVGGKRNRGATAMGIVLVDKTKTFRIWNLASLWNGMHEAREVASFAGHGVPITMACMLTLATLHKLISEESSRREHIRQHLEAALELLMMPSVASGTGGGRRS